MDTGKKRTAAERDSLHKALAFWMDVERESKKLKLELFKRAQKENPIQPRPRPKRRKRHSVRR